MRGGLQKKYHVRHPTFSLVTLKGTTNEYGDGRRNQTLDSQAQERVGDGALAGKDDGGGGGVWQKAQGGPNIQDSRSYANDINL